MTTARCVLCGWFCIGLADVADADRVLDAHHQAEHTK